VSADPIIINLGSMGISVDFDDEFVLSKVKIDNKFSNRVLSANFDSFQLRVTQVMPEDFLCRS